MSVLIKCLVLSFALLSCTSDPISERGKRAAKSDAAKKDIVIGIVASTKSPHFFNEGVNLALKELNQEGEEILGRKISALFYDDECSPEKALEISEQLAENPDVVAVIGHICSAGAISASVTYEKDGIVFISPWASDPALTKYGTGFTFRNTPSAEVIGRKMAEFAYLRKLERISVLYDRDYGVGKRLAEIFSTEAERLELKIFATKSYFSWQDDILLLISDIAKERENFDAIMLGGRLPSAAGIIKQLREMGVNVPIFGTGSLDTDTFSVLAGKSADGTIVPTVFNPRRSTSTTQTFISNFKTEFAVLPDTSAAQGYDALQVLAFAMRKCGVSVPVTVSTTLRSLENWEGITGSYSFTRSGDITGKSVFFKEMRGGDFEFLAGKFEKDRLDLIRSITLRLPIQNAVSVLDPGLLETPESVEVAEQLFLGLTDLDPKTYEAVSELAEKWEVDEDGKTWRFHLRKDAVWTDGSPVTAHDVVWAVQRNLKPETKCPAADMLYFLKNARAIHAGKTEEDTSKKNTPQGGISATDTEIAGEDDAVSDKEDLTLGVTAVDDFTLDFTLEQPVGYFPVIAGFPVYRPLPQKVIEKFGDKWTDSDNIQTSGSYELAVIQKDGLIILRKNSKYYHADKVSIEEVRYYVIKKGGMGLVMYEDEELDIIGDPYLPIPDRELPRVRADMTLGKEYSNLARPCTYAYAFNTLLPPVDHPLVRKAISAAIDREAIIEMVVRGGQKPATTFIPPSVFGSAGQGEKGGINFDPLQAQKWLAEAGYPDGRGFPEITLMYDKSENHAEVARAVQTFLQHHLNIKIKLYESEKMVYGKALRQPNTPHMFRYGRCGAYPDADDWLYELFHPYFSPNTIGWKKVTFAQLIDIAREISDPNERRKRFRRAEQILISEEAAIVPIYFETAPCLVKPRVKGWYNMAAGGQHIRNWRLEE